MIKASRHSDRIGRGCALAAASLLAWSAWAGAGWAQMEVAPRKPPDAAAKPDPTYGAGAVGALVNGASGGAPWSGQPSGGTLAAQPGGPSASGSPYQSVWPKPWWDTPGAKPPAATPPLAAPSDAAPDPAAPDPSAAVKLPIAVQHHPHPAQFVDPAPLPAVQPAPQQSPQWPGWGPALLLAACALLAAVAATWWGLQRGLRLLPISDPGHQEIRFAAAPGLHVVVRARAGQFSTRLHFLDPQASS